jgi:hypothetical protein
VKLATIDEYLAGLSDDKRCARETPKDHPICRAKGRAWWKLFEDDVCMRDMEFCGQHHRLGAIIAAQPHRCTEQAEDLVLAALEVDRRCGAASLVRGGRTGG